LTLGAHEGVNREVLGAEDSNCWLRTSRQRGGKKGRELFTARKEKKRSDTGGVPVTSICPIAGRRLEKY